MQRIALAMAFGFVSLAAPALAADDDIPTPPAPPVAAPDTPPAATPAVPAVKAVGKPAATNGSSAWVGSVGKFGARVASTVVGGAVGMPVAAVRLLHGSDVEYGKSMPFIGESNRKPFIGLSRIVVLPAALFYSAWAAPAYSTVNSWKVSGDKPFSKEAFSFGRLDDTIVPY